jgi:hypothetical protein
VDSSAVPFPLQVGTSPHFFVELQLECDRCATGVQAPKTPALILHSSVSLRETFPALRDENERQLAPALKKDSLPYPKIINRKVEIIREKRRSFEETFWFQ